MKLKPVSPNKLTIKNITYYWGKWEQSVQLRKWKCSKATSRDEWLWWYWLHYTENMSHGDEVSGFHQTKESSCEMSDMSHGDG